MGIVGKSVFVGFCIAKPDLSAEGQELLLQLVLGIIGKQRLVVPVELVLVQLDARFSIQDGISRFRVTIYITRSLAVILVLDIPLGGNMVPVDAESVFRISEAESR